MGVMAFVGMGIAGNLTLAGPDLIRILLGPGWEETGAHLRLLRAGHWNDDDLRHAWHGFTFPSGDLTGGFCGPRLNGV